MQQTLCTGLLLPTDAGLAVEQDYLPSWTTADDAFLGRGVLCQLVKIKQHQKLITLMPRFAWAQGGKHNTI